MKYAYYIIIGLGGLLSSCDKGLLNTIPNDRITSEIYWTQEKDAVLAVNAMYAYLEGEDVFSYDAMSDIARPNNSYQQESYIVRGTYDGFNPLVIEKWTDAYTCIRAVNYFLENVDRIPEMDPDLNSRLKGEARFLRAYQYFRLVRLYGRVPLVTKTLNIEEGKSVIQESVENIYSFIEGELADAASLLPTKQTEAGRITKGVALSFLARVYHYIKKYDKAAEKAKEVIDLDVYSIYPSYERLFSYSAENNAEIILDKQFIANIYANATFNLLAPYSQSSTGAIIPVKKLVDTYDMNNGRPITDSDSGFDPMNPYTNRDPRLQFSMYVLGSRLPDGTTYDSRPSSGTPDAIGYNPGTTKTGFNVKKYVNVEDRNDRTNSGINIILMRYAEILLIYAESKVELNQIDQSVYDAINLIRQRGDVDMPIITIGKNQSELLEIIRKERMIELAFEGHRFFDIRRYGIADEVMNGAPLGMTYISSNGELVTVKDDSFVRFFNPKRDFLWPIPQKDLDLNSNLKNNPNW